MSSPFIVPPNASPAEALRLLVSRHREGVDIPATHPLQPLDAEALVAGLCLGGATFAMALAGQENPSWTEEERQAVVVNAFLGWVEPPADAQAEHEHLLAEELIAKFDLPGQASQLFDLARSELLITAGPLEDVPEAALAAIKRGHWSLALKGFERIQHDLQEKTPPDVYGMMAMCEHQLKRYAEADHWAEVGLGSSSALLAIPPVFSEEELLRRWNGSRSPVISILCMTYNHVRYIESAIRGFLSQDTEYPFEILVHDDASTDGTAEVVRQWAQRYPSIIRPTLQTENQLRQGVRPFELLLAQARGEYVATCEGDDFWVDAGKLQRQVGYMQKHPEVASSSHNYFHYMERTLTVRPWNGIRQDHLVPQRNLMGLQRLLWMPTLVFRKSFSAMPPERNEAAFGDQLLTSYLGSLGPSVVFESRFSAVRRENEFSTWSPLPEAEKERMRVQTWDAIVKMHKRLGNAQAVQDILAKLRASPSRHLSQQLRLEAEAAGQPAAAEG